MEKFEAVDKFMHAFMATTPVPEAMIPMAVTGSYFFASLGVIHLLEFFLKVGVLLGFVLDR